MKDPRDGENIHHDKNGDRYVLDENGNRRPPSRAEPISKPGSGWTDFDTSKGHCGLCGRLTCNGGCFK